MINFLYVVLLLILCFGLGVAAHVLGYYLATKITDWIDSRHKQKVIFCIHFFEQDGELRTSVTQEKNK